MARPRPIDKVTLSGEVPSDRIPIKHWSHGDTIFTYSHMVESLQVQCVAAAFSSASPSTTKSEILTEADSMLTDIKSRGPQFMRDLVGDLLQEFIKAHEFTTHSIRSFSTILKEHIQDEGEWYHHRLSKRPGEL